MHRYFKLPIDKSDEIRSDAERVKKANFALLSELTGVTITEISRAGDLSWGFARLEAVITDTPPTKSGWRLLAKWSNRYAPNIRTKAGKTIAEQVKGLDLLEGLSALQRAGISPFYRNEEAFSAGHAGYNLRTPNALLLWQKDWGDPEWPDWVQEIKGSEYHLILEEA